MEKFSQRFLKWLAWCLPKQLIYWCGVRLGANVIAGKYVNQSPDKVHIVDALKRWNEKE